MSEGDVPTNVGNTGLKKSSSAKASLNKLGGDTSGKSTMSASDAAYGGQNAVKATSKKQSSSKFTSLSTYLNLGCVLLVLFGTYAWGKNSKSIPIYINQHADHACENFMGSLKNFLLNLKNVDRAVVASLDLTKGCVAMDIARHTFPERVAKFQKHVKSHYTHSGGWFGSDHGETMFANTALVHTLVESVLPIGTFMMGIGAWLAFVNLITGIETRGLDFMSCGTFLVLMALMCGTTEGLTIEGMCITALIVMAIYFDPKTHFLSYMQLLLYSVSITVALHHSNDA